MFYRQPCILIDLLLSSSSFLLRISNPRSSNMNNSLPDFLITAWDSLMRNPEIVLAPFVLVVSVWRIVRLRDISVENVDSRLNDTVCKTVIEHTSKKIAALLDQEHLILPHGVHPADIVERMVAHDPHNPVFLSQLYNSLSEFGVQSAFFQQAVAIARGGLSVETSTNNRRFLMVFLSFYLGTVGSQ